MNLPSKIVAREKRVVNGQKHWCFITPEGTFTAKEIASVLGIPRKTFLSRCSSNDCTTPDFLTRQYAKGSKKGVATRTGCKDVHHVAEGVRPTYWELSSEILLNQIRAIEGACPINTGAKVKMTPEGLKRACIAHQKDNPFSVAVEEFGRRPCKKCRTRKQILNGEELEAIPPGIEVMPLEAFL